MLSILLFLVGLSKAQGTSQHSKAIRSYDYPHEIVITQKTIDVLHLSFKAYEDSFEIELMPNLNVIPSHAEAHIHSGGVLQRVLSIPQHKTVYDGRVLAHRPDSGKKQQEVGWARLTFSDSDMSVDDLSIDGVIKKGNEMFHLARIENYAKAKRDIDVEVPSTVAGHPLNQHAHTMIFKDEQPSETQDRWGPDSLLSMTPLHPLLIKRNENKSNTVESFGCEVPHNADAVEQYFASIKKEQASNKVFRRAPSGCPTSMKVLPMGVAADCTYVKSYGSIDKALTQILSDWNAASKIYEQAFNVQLAVVKVDIHDSCDQSGTQPWNQPCSSSYKISTRLSDFSQWRGQFSNDGLGLWHLMTQCSTQPSVGIAWINMLCNTQSQQQPSDSGTQYVSGTGVSSIVPVEWKVVAHEIGHNFGAYHDCMTSNCPCTDSCACQIGGKTQTCTCAPCSPNCDCQGQFLMHPLDNSATDQFSPASINSICSQFPTIGTCLKDPGTISAIVPGICGNGVKEMNEDCDCGSNCDKDPCCDGSTCNFKGNAQCDDLNDNCCINCKFKPAGTTCHSSAGVCDNTLYCSGNNGSCPSNSFFPDGSSCSISAASNTQCSSGVCTSRDLQCASGSGSNSGNIQTVKACPGFVNECSLYCQTADGTCYQLNGNFLDGTTCGYTGRCKKGQCNGGSPFAFLLQWIQMYPQIAYPLLVIGGIIFLSLVIGIIRHCCYKRNQMKPRKTAAQSPAFLSSAPDQDRPQQPIELRHRPFRYQDQQRLQQPSSPADSWTYRNGSNETIYAPPANASTSALLPNLQKPLPPPVSRRGKPSQRNEFVSQ